MLAALSALAAAAGLALVSPSAGDVTNTWSGTWVNSAPDGTFWVFTQSGASVGGVWKGNASSGSLSGTVQGSNLSGTLVNNEAGQSANFSITLAADGHSFSGTFTIVGGSTGQWRSACSGGACLSNAAPPPPPPGGPPGGGSPAPQVSPKLLAAATAWGQVGPATALEPGGEAIATSPQIAPKQRGVSVTLSGDVAGETAIVLGPGHRIQQEVGRLTRGDCVRAVGGAFKFALDAEAGRLGGRSKKYDPRLDEQIRATALGFATYFMVACLDFVEELDRTPVARAARVSCQLSGRQLSVRVDRAADTIHYRTRRASRRAPARLRGSCRQARNGTVTLRIRTASRRIKLRKVLGPRLVVGAYRSVGAIGSANVQMTFKR